MKRRTARIIILLLLIGFAAGVWIWLSRYAAQHMSLLELVELGDLDGVRYVLRWDPGQKKQWGFRVKIQRPPKKGPASAKVRSLTLYEEECTPLTLAISTKHPEIAALLIAAGAEVNVLTSAGATPLQLAARTGDLRVVKLLIAHDAELNVRSRQNPTPLCQAIAHGYGQVAACLLAAGAEPDIANEGARMLQQAAAHGLVGLVKLLIKHQVAVNVRNPGKPGGTALHAAAKNGHAEVVKLLLARGAAPGAQRDDKLAPLHLAAMKGRREVVELLIKHRAKPDVQDKDGWTPLHYAASNGDLEVITLLIEHGANLNARDNDGSRPLDYANEETKKLLKNYGAAGSPSTALELFPDEKDK